MIKELVKLGIAVPCSFGADLLVAKGFAKFLPKIVDVSKLGKIEKIGVLAGACGINIAVNGFICKGVDDFVDEASDAIQMIKNPRKYREDQMTRKIKDQMEMEVAEDAKAEIYETWINDPSTPFTEKDFEKYKKYREKLLEKAKKKEAKKAKDTE